MNEIILPEGINSLAKKEREDALELAMLKQPQVECPVIHRFGPGTYIREVMIPAGTLAIGHHQNFEQMNVFLKGRVTMLNDDFTITELKAPMIYVGKPGRKIGYAHEDMVWLNIYATEERDVEKLEAHFLTKSEGWNNDLIMRRGLKLLQSNVDAKDFFEMLKELGLTPEQVRKTSECTTDMIELPHGSYKIKTGPSHIEGKGLFATSNIHPGELIAPARILGRRTIAGRFTNHSPTPNAAMVRADAGDINLVATRVIAGCQGGQDGDEITINYRDAVRLTLCLGKGQ